MQVTARSRLDRDVLRFSQAFFCTKLADTDGGGGEERHRGATRRLRFVATHTDAMPPKLFRRGPVEYARGRVARRSQPES